MVWIHGNNFSKIALEKNIFSRNLSLIFFSKVVDFCVARVTTHYMDHRIYWITTSSMSVSTIVWVRLDFLAAAKKIALEISD